MAILEPDGKATHQK